MQDNNLKFNVLVECCGQEAAEKLFQCNAFVERFKKEDFARHFKFIISMMPPLGSEILIEFYADESFCTETSSYDKHGYGDETLNDTKRIYALELIQQITILAKDDEAIVKQFLTICHEATQQHTPNPLFPSIKQCKCTLCLKCIDNVKIEDCVHQKTKKWFETDVCECKRCFVKNKISILEGRRQNFLFSLPCLLLPRMKV